MTSLFAMFFYSLFLAITIPIIIPHFHLHYFVPFYIFCFYRLSLQQSLWWTCASGFIFDFYSSDSRLGISVIPFCFTTLALYRYKFYFFEDRFSTLPIMTFLYCLLLTVFESIIYYFEKGIQSDQIIKQALFIGIQNSLFCITTFTLPSYVVTYLQKRDAIPFLR
jgi:hypothetical protein